MDKITANAKIKAYLGFAAKTRSIASGADAVEQAIRAGKAKLVLICSQASNATIERFSFASSAHSVKCVLVNDEVLGLAIGKPERKVVCVLDSKFATAIINEINLIDLGDKK